LAIYIIVVADFSNEIFYVGLFVSLVSEYRYVSGSIFFDPYPTQPINCLTQSNHPDSQVHPTNGHQLAIQQKATQQIPYTFGSHDA